MSASNETYIRVASVLAKCLGVEEDVITPSATLQGDLGAESIDFLDVVFRLKREFGIKIPRGELFPDSVFGDNPEFVEDGWVTDAGVSHLRSCMPYADLRPLDRNRRLSTVADLFTVDLVARYVEWKLQKHIKTGSSVVPEAAVRSGTTDCRATS
jgi:acyl carrier protein